MVGTGLIDLLVNKCQMIMKASLTIRHMMLFLIKTYMHQILTQIYNKTMFIRLSLENTLWC